MKTIDIPIRGMDCAECAAHVQHAIQSVDNVSTVQVFLGAEKAKVAYEGNELDFEEIRKAVAAAGYRAEPGGENGKPGSESTQIKNLGWLFGLIAGLVVLIALAGELFGLFDQLNSFIPWYIWLTLVLVGGFPIFRKVLSAALQGRIISHTLMTLGVAAAAAVGEWPTAVVVVIFMRVGDFVENYTTGRARRAVKDLSLLSPQTARVDRNGKEIEIPIEQVHTGDTVIVRPGESIPVDGEVIAGSASVDQSAITGESIPVEAEPGTRVFGASILKNGAIRVKTTAVGEASTFGKIIRLVEEAEANRGEFQRAADRFAGYYLPVVATVAGLTYLISRDWLSAAAVLVVACSCSFTLATPIAMLAAIGSAAKQGLLIKGGKVVERLAKVDTLFVDKTGTLTLGEPKITDVIPIGTISSEEFLVFTASAEKYSEHPLAEAVRQAAVDHAQELFEPEEFENLPGKGIRAVIDGKSVEILNKPKKTQTADREEMDALLDEGKTLLFVHIDGELAGFMAAADTPREEIRQAFSELNDIGIDRIEIISGDSPSAVAYIAEPLDVSYQGGLLPEEKIALIREAQASGRITAMVGDGINDAPALAQADVGIAMGAKGSDIAIETAHLALMREDWLLIPEAFRTARRAMGVVKGNIFFTAVYNLGGLTLAAFGILPPILAAALQSLPDLGILANSARLLRTK